MNVGSWKSIYLIIWWLGMSKINFPLHLDKIKFKCLFQFSMFRILKNRLKRTNIYTDFFFLESQVIWCERSAYKRPLFVASPKAKIKGSISNFPREGLLILQKLVEIIYFRMKEQVFIWSVPSTVLIALPGLLDWKRFRTHNHP